MPAPKPAQTAVMAAGIAPPIAMLWATANTLPAATLPIPACITAATVPSSPEGLDATSALGRELTGDGSDRAEAQSTQKSRG